MTTYKQILAAVDFSVHTDAVIQNALREAECSGARVTVVHVVDYSRPIDDDYIIPPDDAVEEALLVSARERLDQRLQRLGAAHARALVVSGRPKQEILRMAEREAADLIVIGAHGHHGLAGLLGSTTDRVLHRAACSVLTVK